MKIKLTAEWVALVLLALAVALGGLAWGLQSAAGNDLVKAREVQKREVPEDDSAPPDLGDYRLILETLDRSITIRRRIDGVLATIERRVEGFQNQQRSARHVSVTGRQEIDAIAALLGGASKSTRSAVKKLRELGDAIDVSADLSVLIAEELEELDRSLGPTVGDGPTDLLERKRKQ
ncbi:MAG: hypothetical protein M3280_09795 [Actinomycetota bacterium]|nr:hypothetical protein [Actinomycetota bacterium]